MFQFLILVLILTIFFLTRRKGKMKELYNQMPCYSTWYPIIGHSYKYLGSAENSMKSLDSDGKYATSKGGLMGLWHANVLYIMVTDALAMEYILKNCLEKDDVLKATRIIIGNGSIYAPVSIWRRRRKTVAPFFNAKNLNSFINTFARQTRVQTNKLQSFAEKGPISVWEYMTATTVASICETTMGVSLEGQKLNQNALCSIISQLLELSFTRMSNPLLHSDFVFKQTSMYTKCRKYVDLFCEFANEIIHQRRKTLKEQGAENLQLPDGPLKLLVDMFIELGEDQFNEEELREELMVLITAGTDTSAIVDGFFLLLLARHPDVQEKVYQDALPAINKFSHDICYGRGLFPEEISFYTFKLYEVFGDSDRLMVAEDISHLKYLDAVIKETMRLYPPVPLIVRKIDRDITLPSGVKLLKGCGAFLNIWGLHRNPKYWGPDAEVFRPERFLESQLSHPAAYIPFSTGNRNCVGMQYAYMSMKTILSDILRRYRVLPAPDPVTGEIDTKEPFKLKYSFMLKHADWRVQLQRRS